VGLDTQELISLFPLGAGSVGAFGEPTDFDDPLSAGQNCTRDVSHLKDIGVNTVRVYSVNSSVSHDECMKTFRSVMTSHTLYKLLTVVV
jgi:hypothetical protein